MYADYGQELTESTSEVPSYIEAYVDYELMARDYQLEKLNERRDEYIKALILADGHDFSALLKFVGL